jgi:hypothetical protein
VNNALPVWYECEGTGDSGGHNTAYRSPVLILPAIRAVPVKTVQDFPHISYPDKWQYL